MEVNSGRFDGRANLKPWKPGQSGNSAGKLKARAKPSPRDLSKTFPPFGRKRAWKLFARWRAKALRALSR